MTANIFGERFYGTREPAWHGLGKVFAEPIAPSKAVTEIGLDYEVHTHPLFAEVNGTRIDSKRFSILRSPTADDPIYREFGTASKDYEIVQNTDLAEILDPLAEVWPLETMGALDHGKTVFMTLDCGESEIEDDPIKNFFMLMDRKDGGTAARLVYTPVRVVCGNTLVTGLRAATVNIKLQHTTGVGAQLKARVDLIARAKSAVDDTTKLFRKLAEKKVATNVIEDLYTKVYKAPKQPADAALIDYPQEELGEVLAKSVSDSMYAYNYYTNVAQTNQANAMDLYEKLGDEYPSLAGSLWHAYNAVVELADYRLGGQSPEQSALFGARSMEKKRAFKEVAKLAR